MADGRPIGLFDSGIGGLTVARALSEHLPDERLVYFGDTAHHPYGEKSPDHIRLFSDDIARFLIGAMDCKVLVIACNTASAIAYASLRDRLAGRVPVINVIDPVVEAVVASPALQHVGVIATQTTVDSGVYQEKLARRRPDLRVSALATPLLAPMIEEGFGGDDIREAILHRYLDDPALDGIDGLILGCTHYPLIRALIEAVLGPERIVFDSTDIVAGKLARILDAEGLRTSERTGPDRFFVSDYTTTFESSARRFYDRTVDLTQHTVSTTH